MKTSCRTYLPGCLTAGWLILLVLVLQGTSPAAGRLYRQDPGLLILPTTVMQDLKQGEKRFLVDIRQPSHFRSFKIPGSLNIPLALIKTKSFLKTAPVVLVNEGYRCRDLATQAAELNQAGFTVKILQGGLLAWKHRGGALAGDWFARNELNRINCRTLIESRDLFDLSIVQVASAPSKELNAMFPESICIPDGRLNDTIQMLFSGKPSFHQAVVVTRDGSDNDTLASSLNNEFRDRVFFLEGGADAFDQIKKERKLAARPLSRRKVSTGPCSPCQKKLKNLQ